MGYPVSPPSWPRLRRARHRRRRAGHHIVLVLAGVGGNVNGLADAAYFLRSGHRVTEATLKTGLTLPSVTVGADFSELWLALSPPIMPATTAAL